MESEDDDGDLRHPGTVAENMTVGARRAPGARTGEGGRRGVGSAGGAGSSVVVVNVNVDDFPTPLLMVAS